MNTVIYDSIYNRAVLSDFVSFKCNYCVKSVIESQSHQ
ncbi:hypothetical protein TSAR_007228 [Trichomalopsis sarcophagae]|uniref:Uncharacterized protein n=1 Tax=Trichomalopsis sarcophagae TaxID=543379 RepID=A0A232ETG0_9HYME|nr:hypothetical protein TSAR_007228 [Trichomalopsis sarcophagae]